MTPKPLKFGEVEWMRFGSLPMECRCKPPLSSGCDGLCTVGIEALDFIEADEEEEAEQYEFAVSKVDGSIVMARKIGGSS